MTTTCRGGRSRAGQLFGGHVRDRPGCQGCWYPERRKEMDAAVASETRITAATIPCSGAFTSGADAAQGSSSGGRICSYTCCGFAAPRMSHIAKKGGHFRSNFRDLPIGSEQKLKPEIGHFFSNPAHFLKSVLPMRSKGWSILALEQLPASPLRTGTPFGGHQHR